MHAEGPQICQIKLRSVVVFSKQNAKKDKKNLPINPEKAAIALPPIWNIRDAHLESVHLEICAYLALNIHTCGCEESHSDLHVL